MNRQIIGRGWAFPPQIDEQGRVALSDERDDIEQAIRIILSTSPGERVMRPTFGSRLHELVFAPVNAETAALAAHHVEEALNMWEPRITVTEVRIDPHRDNRRPHARLQIEIDYEINATYDRRTLVYPFYVIPGE